VIPPITTHQQLVLVERALQLARVEKQRANRDQEVAHVSHIQAGRQVGLDSLRGRLGDAMIAFGRAVAGGDWPERGRNARTASAHR
jgi:hypothetical protein